MIKIHLDIWNDWVNLRYQNQSTFKMGH